MGIYYKYPLYLRMVIDIPSDELDQQAALMAVARIIDVAFVIADNIAAMKLSSNTLDKCNKSRKKIKSAHKHDNEEVLEKKAREAKAVEAEKLRKMTPEE